MSRAEGDADVRIAELSKRSGVAVATIKYYLREGVLPPGERTSPNQAAYDDAHVHRLRLVRALIEVGGLSVAAVREVLSAVDTPGADVAKTLGAVQTAIYHHAPAPEETPALAAAEDEIAALLDDLGWHCAPDFPPTRALAAALVKADELGQPALRTVLRRYAEAAATIARADLDYLNTAENLDDTVERAVVGMIIGDSAIAALRRLAQATESQSRYREED